MHDAIGNELINIAHCAHDPAEDILLATVTFDFAQSQPVTEIHNEEKEGVRTCEFLFPHATISDRQVQVKIDALHKSFNTSACKIALDTIDTPTPGIRIVVRFDAHTVDFVYGSYDSIVQRGAPQGFDTGIAFALYNKPIMRKIDGKKYEPTMYSASYDGKKKVCTYEHA